MTRLIIALLFLPLLLQTTPLTDDEFLGPFLSWTILKSTTGDDTAAIQRALDDLGKPGHSPVLFLPSGTYRIRKTLVLASRINISIVGEDPSTTTLVWDGEPGGTMLWLNGIAYSRFDRLTFDGKGRASVAVEQSWDMTQSHFDTGNAYTDDRFLDVEFGIHGGFKGGGFAETSIRRAQFLRNTKAGVALGNFNALDIWIWDSLFEDCHAGVTNTPGAGNFHVYRSVFRRSKLADMSIGNTGGFSARGNYSLESKAFFIGSSTNNPAQIDIQRNTIIDPIDGAAIRIGNQGPALIIDNVIRSRATAVGPVVVWRSFMDADVTSVGNTFTVRDPVNSNGRLITIDDRVVARSAIQAAEPKLPGAAPDRHRQVFEVPAGAGAREIQNAITAAAREIGKRPVVHIPSGTYSISETLNVPAGDIQITGDGYGTILSWPGAGAGPVMRLIGPSKATLREFQVDGAGKVDGIVVENADQLGARVYMRQAELRAGRETNLFVNTVGAVYDRPEVQLEDFGYAYSPDAVSIKVAGRGKTNIFSGASSGHRISYEVSNGARVLVRDLWYESGAGPGFANIHDDATFTIDGARISSPMNASPAAFHIHNLNGRVAILSTDMDDRIEVSGNGRDARVLALGVIAERRTPDYFVVNAEGARAVLLNSRQLSWLPGSRTSPTPDSGVVDRAFVGDMLAHTRAEMPGRIEPLPAGITDVRLYRVWVSNGRNNIRVVSSE
jgi:hypothetical protein